jgi:hypothetical protein
VAKKKGFAASKTKTCPPVANVVKPFAAAIY